MDIIGQQQQQPFEVFQERGEEGIRKMIEIVGEGNIPLVGVQGNLTPISSIPVGSLVKVIGMVRDILDVEMVVPQAVFRDNIQLPDLDLDQFDWSTLVRRQPIHLSSIPGETEWIQQSRSLSSLENRINSMSLSESCAHSDAFDSLQVILYGESQEHISVCTAYEFYGILGGESEALGQQRLHCMWRKPLQNSAQSSISNSGESIAKIRSEFLEFISRQITLGDELTAELLLVNMISSVRSRVQTGGALIGTFALNVVAKQENGKAFLSRVGNLFSDVLERFQLIHVSLQNLENSSYISKKDFETGKMSSGILQVVSDTQLLVDELSMEPGNLSAKAYSNLLALQSLIKEQTVCLDFEYHQVSVPVNTPSLIVSNESKSILQICNAVIWSPLSGFGDDEQMSFSAEGMNVEGFRAYLQMVKSNEVQVPDDMSQTIEKDLEIIRDRYNCTSNALLAVESERLLNLARLLACTAGDQILHESHWKHALEMDLCSLQRFRQQS